MVTNDYHIKNQYTLQVNFDLAEHVSQKSVWYFKNPLALCGGLPKRVQDGTMGIVRSCRSWAGTLVLITVLSVCGIQVNRAEQLSDRLDEKRPDMITINTARDFGDLERPAVLFLHDQHTQAVEKKGGECSLCHPMTEKYQSLKFKQEESSSKEELMDVYHTGCIGCHRDTAADQSKSGPVECGGCHRKQVPFTSSWRALDFDKSLHHRHVKARGDKCDECHHEYDKSAKKLFYAKGKEASCRYCHMTRTEENRISMSAASHLSCIDCHRKTTKAKNTAGAVMMQMRRKTSRRFMMYRESSEISRMLF